MWGGIECTLTRVGSERYDQLAECGHYTRASDLERIAGLGIRTLRYPVLWERAAAGSPSEYDWRFADERLTMLRELGITPIAGLVHHGSGPDGMDMRSEEFARGLARYAREVARRFPWIENYTPVNEPLTTARFCGLYGHWFPHGRDDATFARILINECRAIILAMKAIREVIPGARLVQTEDLGTIYSSGRLAYQAEFENHRRWLAWDLLCGFVDHTHALHDYLVSSGIRPSELSWFLDNACQPQVIGIDHYVTSDRFLDEKVHLYPPSCRGSNGRDSYADVEAVRVLDRPGTSLRHVIQDCARRYRTPVALTEVHLGCTEDEQVRWLHEAWTTCAQLANHGVDIAAVTAWALLGSYDWDSLLTRRQGHYESGAFCLRAGEPRATAVAGYIRALTCGEPAPGTAAVVRTEGWWRRQDRLLQGTDFPITALIA